MLCAPFIIGVSNDIHTPFAHWNIGALYACHRANRITIPPRATRLNGQNMSATLYWETVVYGDTCICHFVLTLIFRSNHTPSIAG